MLGVFFKSTWENGEVDDWGESSLLHSPDTQISTQGKTEEVEGGIKEDVRERRG